MSFSGMRGHRIALLGMTAGLFAGPVGAQELQDRQHGTIENPNEVQARPRPGYDATGIKAGSFVVLPYLDSQLLYDDNVFASNVNRKSDVSGLVTAGVEAHSDWSQHYLAVTATGAVERFAKLTDQNSERGSVQALGRIDVRRNLSVNLNGRIARQVETRGSQGDAFIIGSVPIYTVKEGGGGIQFNPGRVGISVNGLLSDYGYRAIDIGGTKVSQKYRNYRQTVGGGRLSYSVSPDLTVFASGSYSDISYRNRQSDYNLDSHNLTALGGVNFSITRLVVGEIGVGWIGERFSDSRFKNASGLAYDASVTWNPTTLVSVSLAGHSTVDQSAVVGVAGVLRRDVTLGADYEVLRNLIVHAEASVIDRKYRGDDRGDDLYAGQLGIKYLLNRYLNLGLTYRHEGQRSSGPGARDYDANRVSLSLRLQR